MLTYALYLLCSIMSVFVICSLYYYGRPLSVA